MGNLNALLDHASRCAELLRESESATIVAHHDADGVTTAAILKAALDRASIGAEVKFVPQADPSILDGPEGPLVLWAELGSSLLEEMKPRPYRSLVVDHHPPSGRPGGRVEMLNPYSFGFEGSTEISGAGVAVLLARALDPANNDLADLGVVGALADSLDRAAGRLPDLARTVLDAGREAGVVEAAPGLRAFGASSRPLVVCLSGLPGIESPGRVASFLRELGLPARDNRGWLKWANLDSFQQRALARALLHLALATGTDPNAVVGETYLLPGRPPPLRDGAEFASLLNATARYGRGEVGLALCLESRGLPEAAALAGRHRRAISKGVRALLDGGPVDRRHYRYFDGRGSMPEQVVGAVATASLRRLRDPGPMVVFASSRQEGAPVLKVSARAFTPRAPLGPALALAARRAGGVGGGHGCAAGARIPADGLEPFLASLDAALSPGSATPY